MGLEKLNLKIDKHGFIETNENFQTSISNIYAIGDVIKGPMLAHKAEEDGVAAVEIINGEAGHVDYNLVPGIHVYVFILTGERTVLSYITTPFHNGIGQALQER